MVACLWTSSACHSRSHLLPFFLSHTSVRLSQASAKKITLVGVTNYFPVVNSNNEFSVKILFYPSTAFETVDNSNLFYTVFPQLVGVHIHSVFFQPHSILGFSE